jgi:hypothetical protein
VCTTSSDTSPSIAEGSQDLAMSESFNMIAPSDAFRNED